MVLCPCYRTGHFFHITYFKNKHNVRNTHMDIVYFTAQRVSWRGRANYVPRGGQILSSYYLSSLQQYLKLWIRCWCFNFWRIWWPASVNLRSFEPSILGSYELTFLCKMYCQMFYSFPKTCRRGSLCLCHCSCKPTSAGGIKLPPFTFCRISSKPDELRTWNLA